MTNKASQLINGWLHDESGYDEKTYPILERALNAPTHRTVYQLCAVGPRAHFNSLGKILSKRVFTSKAAALAHQAEFVQSCLADLSDTHAQSFNDLGRVDQCNIIELELIEDIQ